MPKGVGSDFFDNAGSAGVFGDEAFDASGSKSLILALVGSVKIDKEEGVEVLAAVEIVFEMGFGLVREKDDAEFLTLATDAKFVFG